MYVIRFNSGDKIEQFVTSERSGVSFLVSWLERRETVFTVSDFTGYLTSEYFGFGSHEGFPHWSHPNKNPVILGEPGGRY